MNSKVKHKQLDMTEILLQISELYGEFQEVLEEWENEKNFKKLDRLTEIKCVFKNLKIDWLDNI